MRDVYPSDDDFRNSFATKQERSSPKIQYLLKTLDEEERKASAGASAKEMALPDTLTVEHIFPRNPGTEWSDITDADPLLIEDTFFDRLGNMCLLSDINRRLGRKAFSEKKPFYDSSLIITTKSVAENDIWNRQKIEHRQAYMAKRAVSAWRFR